MRGYNLSISKLALISTLTIFLIGFSAASFSVNDVSSTSEEKIYTTGEISISENGGQKIGLIEGEEIEVNTVQNQISEFEGFYDETKPEPGERVDLGVIYSEDGVVNFRDDVRYIDGETGEEIGSYTNLNVYSREDGTYYFRIPDYNPKANHNDIIEIDGQFREVATDNPDLADIFGLDDGHSPVTLYDSIENEQKTVYVDNSGLEFNSAELGESKDTINLQFENKGPAPVNEEELRNEDGGIRNDLFTLKARETKLGRDDPKISEIAFNEEDTSFTVTLNQKFQESDELDISTTDSLQDILGNKVEASTKTVEGLYSSEPEIVEFNLDKDEITHGEKVSGEVLVRSLDRPELDISTGSLDLLDENFDLQKDEGCDFDSNACYKAEVDFTYTSGESGEQSIEVTATNDNGDSEDFDTVDVKTRSNSVEEILVFDGDEDGSIDEAKVKFDQEVDPETFVEGQWSMNGEELGLEEGQNELTDTIMLEAENGVDSTDAGDVDVTHEPGSKNYLAYKDGVRVAQLDAGDINEKDKAAPVLEDIKVMKGYDHGVLLFSEPVTSIEHELPWTVEIVKHESENTERAVAEFSGQIDQGHLDEDSTWTITASDEDSNQIQSESGMTESNLIGLNSDWNLVSLPEEGSLEGNTDVDLSEDYNWIDSAFNYKNGWEIASSLKPNQGTYINTDGAGVLEFKANNKGSPAAVPGNLADGWNLLSPFRFEGDGEEQKIGFFSETEICSDEEYDIVSTEPNQVDDPCEGEEFNEKTSVFNGYWVADPQ